MCYDPLATVSHSKPNHKRYYRLPKRKTPKPHNFWRYLTAKWHAKLIVGSRTVLTSEQILAKVANYNEAVGLFNIHDGYRDYTKVMGAYRTHVENLKQLEIIAASPATAASAADRKNQLAKYLSRFSITESGVAVSTTKIKLLQAAEVYNAHHIMVNHKWPKGIGRQVMGPLLMWVNGLTQKFIYRPDAQFLVMENSRILKNYPIQRKQLRQEIDAYATTIIEIKTVLCEASDFFDDSHSSFLKEFTN